MPNLKVDIGTMSRCFARSTAVYRGRETYMNGLQLEFIEGNSKLYFVSSLDVSYKPYNVSMSVVKIFSYINHILEIHNSLTVNKKRIVGAWPFDNNIYELC